MIWYRSNQLRWRRVSHPHGGYDMVLEQFWHTKDGAKEEWRSIPEDRDPDADDAD